MSVWTRETTLGPARDAVERWSVDGEELSVEVRVGKPLDVVALKDGSLGESREYERGLRATAGSLYAQTSPVERCPCCQGSAFEPAPGLTVFGVNYARCADCRHLFVGARPTRKEIEARLADDSQIASTYVDPRVLEVRMREVVQPKLDWIADLFGRSSGREARSLLDVGAGGGHVVAGARRAGLAAEGIEISGPSRDFATEAFGVELHDCDFLASPTGLGQFDVVSFFGLLEYVPEPRAFLAGARAAAVADGGMVVVEVPRADSLSTAAQAGHDAVIARHADPTTHVNLFSDASLMTALWDEGLRPVAAWYFGMDAFELLVQVAHALDDDTVVSKAAGTILALQDDLDTAWLCDDIVVAAVPR